MQPSLPRWNRCHYPPGIRESGIGECPEKRQGRERWGKGGGLPRRRGASAEGVALERERPQQLGVLAHAAQLAPEVADVRPYHLGTARSRRVAPHLLEQLLR